MQLGVKVLCCAMMLWLCACAPEMTPQQQAVLEELARRPVTCTKGADCDAKWNRAIEWVGRHSDMGIKTISENLIETNKVKEVGGGPGFPEFSVIRYRQNGNVYVMKFSTYCDDGFKCNPSGLKLRASFGTFIMGPPPGVKVQGGY